MEIKELLNKEENYLGKEIEVSGIFDRPRKKHSDYLFFNITDDYKTGIQAVVKSEIVGKETFRQLTHQGLQHGNTIVATGTLQLRNSTREEFYKYELIVHNLQKTCK
jgi:hypothetical protein